VQSLTKSWLSLLFVFLALVVESVSWSPAALDGTERPAVTEGSTSDASRSDRGSPDDCSERLCEDNCDHHDLTGVPGRIEVEPPARFSTSLVPTPPSRSAEVPKPIPIRV
jgi:hypothetical protein